MAKALATEARVGEIADAIEAEGAEPSILTVQARIGGGSFSTVKRHLDRWREERAARHNAAPETPAEVRAKAEHLGREIWVAAHQRAIAAARLEVAEAQECLRIVRAELTEATQVITRLEDAEQSQRAAIESRDKRIRELEIALAEARTRAQLVGELEARLVEQGREIQACRKEASASAVRAAELLGAATALREQLQTNSARKAELLGRRAGSQPAGR